MPARLIEARALKNSFQAVVLGFFSSVAVILEGCLGGGRRSFRDQKTVFFFVAKGTLSRALSPSAWLPEDFELLFTAILAAIVHHESDRWLNVFRRGIDGIRRLKITPFQQKPCGIPAEKACRLPREEIRDGL